MEIQGHSRNKKRWILFVGIVFVLLILSGFFWLSRSNEQSLVTARNRKRVDDLQNVEHALMLYRVTVKSYPASIDMLVPDYFTVIPTDPLDGKTMSDPRCAISMGSQTYSYQYTPIAGGTSFALEACLENDSIGVLKFAH